MSEIKISILAICKKANNSKKKRVKPPLTLLYCYTLQNLYSVVSLSS